VDSTAQPSPSIRRSSDTDALDSPIIVIEGSGDTTRRPRPRDIPGMPPGAFDLPPALEQPKKHGDDGLKDNA
jgi:hypothetical protein